MLALVAGEPIAEEGGALLEGLVRRHGDQRDALPIVRLQWLEEGKELGASRAERVNGRPEVRLVVARLRVPRPGTHALPGRAVLLHDAHDVAAEDVLACAEKGQQGAHRPFCRTRRGVELALA